MRTATEIASPNASPVLTLDALQAPAEDEDHREAGRDDQQGVDIVHPLDATERLLKAALGFPASA